MAWMALKMLGCLALLMFGMKSMSEALQKMAGPQLRHVLGTMTTNRFTGMLTGMFVTASVQSSTATTLMTVSFVNAGLLTLMQAISIILGAHIGTTVTAWIMSLGFSFNIANFVYPAFFIGIILVYMNKKRVVGDFLFGVGFLFLGLTTLKETGFAVVQDPAASASISAFFARFSDPNFFNSLFFLVMGTVLTLCVQSSAAIMAITMILCSTGVLHIDQGIMLVLGENIGTTITANIVALSANTQARRAALAHFTINVIGVIWVVIVLKWFLGAVCHVVGFDLGIRPGDEGYAANLAKISVVLATFHSAFNVSNTFLQIWFIKYIEKFVCRVIKPKNSDEEEDSRLHFISSGLMGTPELSLLEARKEISLFAVRTQKMFHFVPDLLAMKNENDFVKLFARIEKYEGISDNMEIEIGDYLNKVGEGRLSPESKTALQCMLKEISEIESMGDACYNMARAINRKFRCKGEFTQDQLEHIKHLMQLCDNAMTHMIGVLNDVPQIDVNRTLNFENEINDYRKLLKEKNVADIESQKYSYQIGVHYMDIVNDCEKLGDYIVNVVEAHANRRLSV
ncbi:phosphate:Na+ symporter [Fibrobacter sp. UWB16]|jgi:phosphate:Na+ symporter|uniref:Na/Pi cotransporter family protein n=1 Tax=Fibrobacter TaxID=832 RepID=UPI00091C26F7|nr:Na/Pi cotransporter family protein [Fibrobacter succinogenes]MBO4830166.1 Na/Pi cotransporter family protein [Fibrobacter sp.]OWV23529.1 Na+/Pi-cotransporter [Fibrobacter sp. UWB2]SHM07871.1 phosphate:Na+ symporter [Fibrobacter sp. UWB7]SOD13427.1 phosphate:Na+ symporter [Fibrobacter sp. UWB16]MBQ2559370.1 Na/Pi cotransporter family protein [Fibrobacter sp.]